MKNWIWILAFLWFAGEVKGQGALKDTLNKQLIKVDSLGRPTLDSLLSKSQKSKFMPNPKTATMLALIPGGGQLYNRDYWKLGLVYAAMAGGTWTSIYWSVRYNDMKRGYFSFYDEEFELKPGYTIETVRPVLYRGGILNGKRVDDLELTLDQVNRLKNQYRRYKGLSIIATGFIYTLSIIEANVAAHLKTFDLSEDLALRIEPKISQPMVQQPAPGLRLVFSFK